MVGRAVGGFRADGRSCKGGGRLGLARSAGVDTNSARRRAAQADTRVVLQSLPRFRRTFGCVSISLASVCAQIDVQRLSSTHTLGQPAQPFSNEKAAERMDGLEDLIALGGDPPEHGRSDLALVAGMGHADALPPLLAEERALAEGLDDLSLVQALAEQPQRKRYEQRSWEVCQHARDVRAAMSSKRSAETERAEVKRLRSQLGEVAATFPVVARTLGLPSERRPFDERRALTLMRLAFGEAIRGASQFRKVQADAVALVAATARALQHSFVSSILRPPPLAPSEQTLEDPLVCVHTLEWQWDETAQRVKGLQHDRMTNEHMNHANAAVQVMVQTGLLRSYRCRLGGMPTQTVHEQVFCRSLLLQEQTADFILEGLLRSLPFDISDPTVVEDLASKCDFLVLSCAMDRASANFKVLDCIWSMLEGATLPHNVLLHAEPCVVHGLALVKARPRGDTASIISVSHTFSTLLRQWRMTAALRNSIIKLVSENLVVRREARPATIAIAARQLTDALYGGAESQHLYKTDRHGVRQPGRLLEDLQALAAVVDLGSGDLSNLTHWCFVDTADNDADTDAMHGAACCRSREESIEKVVVPLLNWIVNKAWDTSAVNRWTYVSTTLKKLAVSCLAHRILPEALKDMQLFWKVDDGMESTLARMIAADNQDFASKNKLRLLRVTRCFNDPQVPWKIALVVTSLNLVDQILWAVLGLERDRVTVAELLDEASSPFSVCQQALWAHLASWGADAPNWAVFRELGGDFASRESWVFARRQLLQVSSALVGHFEIRMSAPPYILLKLVDPGLGEERKRRVAEDFLRWPQHCLGQYSARLRSSCPSVDSLLGAKGQTLLRAFGDTRFLAIDFSERAHAQQRLDLRSGGRARRFELSADRLLCQQVRAEHRRRSGVDPARAMPALADHETSSSNALAPSRAQRLPQAKKGGNPKFLWLNHRRSVYKQLHSPDRPLSVEERRQMEHTLKQEWEGMTTEERGHWSVIYQAQRWASRVASGPGELAPHTQNFKSLWATGCENQSCCALPPSAIVAERSRRREVGQAMTAREEEAACRVLAPVPARAARTSGSTVFGCAANKKSICRDTLGDQARRDLDALCAKVARFVGSLGVEAAHSAETLVWFHGHQPADSAEGPARSCRQNVVALLVDARYSPKVQYFARCALKDQAADFRFEWPGSYPFEVNIMNRPARLSPGFKAAFIVNSDELCLDLVQECKEWELKPLRWEPVLKSSLLGMLVVGAGETFVHTSSAKARPNPTAGDAPDFLDADPFEHGARLAARTPTFAPGAGCAGLAADGRPSDAAEQHDEQWPGAAELLFGDDEADALLGLPDVLKDDALDAFHELSEEDCVEEEDTLEEAGGAGKAAADDCAAVAYGAAEDVEDAAASALEEQAGAGSESVGHVASPAAAAAAAIVGTMGYVTCPLAGWAPIPMVGRLTTWPESKPYESRSVSIKCFMHPRCGSPAKVRWKVSDEQLMTWLFSGAHEPNATQERRRALAAEHKALWGPIFAGASANASPTPAASASGAASSSSACR